MVAQLGSGYHLMGVATPSTQPDTVDYSMAYFAATAGEYTAFGGITLAAGEVAVLLTSGNGGWSKNTFYMVPTTTEDLENTSGFITNTVTDLVNYYTKGEIDGQKAQTDAALADRYTKNETDTHRHPRQAQARLLGRLCPAIAHPHAGLRPSVPSRGHRGTVLRPLHLSTPSLFL